MGSGALQFLAVSCPEALIAEIFLTYRRYKDSGSVFLDKIG